MFTHAESTRKVLTRSSNTLEAVGQEDKRQHDGGSVDSTQIGYFNILLLLD